MVRAFGCAHMPPKAEHDCTDQSLHLVLIFRRHPQIALCLVALLVTLGPAGCGRRSAESYLRAGDQAVHDNQLASAQQNYEMAVKLAPEDPRAHLALGNLYLSQHDYTAAEIEFAKLASLKPNSASTHEALAKLAVAQSQLGPAEDQWRAAAAIDPSQPEYRHQLAMILIRRNRSAEAEAQLRTAVGLAPNDAHMHLALANFLSTLPNARAEADAEYARVRQLDPSLVPAAPSAAAPPPAGPAPEAAAPPPPAGPAPEASAVAPGASGPPGPPSGETASTRPIKPLNRRFRLTHDSEVYQNPDSGSPMVGHVHRRKFVRVTGITGSWLQVRLRDGTVGFVPIGAAE